MNTIATLHQLRQRLGLDTADTADDDRLLDALQAATAQIERLAGRRFTPRLATVEHSVNPVDTSELTLDDDLLELTTLTNGNGSVVSSADIVILPDSGGDNPIGIIRLTGGNSFVWDETPLRAIQINGIWGYHDHWSEAWRDSSDTVQDNPFGASATTLTVADADGTDAESETPRFQVGQLLRIESEYLPVLAINTATNVLTVARAVNGTTAASHAQDTLIEVFQPPLDVEMLALQWAAWLYKEPDNRVTGGIPLRFLEWLRGLRRVGVKA